MESQRQSDSHWYFKEFEVFFQLTEEITLTYAYFPVQEIISATCKYSISEL